MSTIDVVIPCYKYAHFLEGCVASVLSQRDVDVRVLIIDDCSPDNTPDVAARLVAADPRVGYVRNEKNLGLIGTSNRGMMDWASAPYSLLLSADDVLSPGSLARAVSVLERHPEAGMVYGLALIHRNGNALPSTIDAHEANYSLIKGEDIIRRSCDVGCPAPSPTVVVRTSMQHKVGGYTPALKHTSDMEMWMRFGILGPVAVIQNIQAFYGWHDENMSIGHMIGAVGDRRQQLAAAQSACSTPGGAAVPDFTAWIDGMKQRFIRETLALAGEAYELKDKEAVAACHAFIAELDPSFALPAMSWKRTLKRMIGRKAVTSMRTAAARYLGLRTPYSELSSKLGWFSEGRVLGWWPAADASAPAASDASQAS